MLQQKLQCPQAVADHVITVRFRVLALQIIRDEFCTQAFKKQKYPISPWLATLALCFENNLNWSGRGLLCAV